MFPSFIFSTSTFSSTSTFTSTPALALPSTFTSPSTSTPASTPASTPTSLHAITTTSSTSTSASTSSLASTPVSNPTCFAIDLPPKIWRPRITSRWQPSQLTDDIDDGYFDYECYGSKCLFRPKQYTPTVKARDDIIIFDHSSHQEELDTCLSFHDSVSLDDRNRITYLITLYWDCFCKEGVRRPILGFEFGIDTGDAKPVQCPNQSYGYHEAKIIMKQVQDLLNNGWITECHGPWISKIVLAPKPHQESCQSIDDFIWRMCVSYRALNGVTKPFAYPMTRCDDAVAFITSGGRYLHFITVDARQGYHQIAVRAADREKLGFAAPDGKKYTYTVMPFGPMNAPPFYTCVMRLLKEEWDADFILAVKELGSIRDTPLFASDLEHIFIGPYRVIIDSKTIIDDILSYCCTKELLLLYFESICKTFLRYRVSFRLDKCDFLHPRSEFVGHDITSNGNCPARSKFDLLRDWKLPSNGQGLLSFISFCQFYAKFNPLIELKNKALRRLAKKFFRAPIPSSAWTPELIQLFSESKSCILSSPVLARYDPDLPLFLKTDWSASGMSWILMQPARDEVSMQAVTTLMETGENLFDLSSSGPRLLPLAFGSRACSPSEQHWHSFVGEAGTGRWAMCQNKKFLWGLVHPFYWMCDCLAMKEIFEYNGSISQIARWAQEMLGYNFVIVHRSFKVMIDVDALNRLHDKRLALYIAYTSYFKLHDRTSRPLAYDRSTFSSLRKTTLPSPEEYVPVIHSATLTDSSIFDKYSELLASTHLEDPPSPIFTISSHPVTTSDFVQSTPSHPSDKSTSQQEVALATPHVHITCINDTFDSFPSSWGKIFSHSSLIQRLFTSSEAFSTFTANSQHPALKIDLCKDTLHQHLTKTNLLLAAFIPDGRFNVSSWISLILQSALSAINESPSLQFILLWCPSSFASDTVRHSVQEFSLQHFAPIEWTFASQVINSADLGSCISAPRTLFTFASIDSPPSVHIMTNPSPNLPTTISPHLDLHRNHWSNCIYSFVHHKHPTFHPTIQDPSVFIFTSSSAQDTTIIDPCGVGQEPLHSRFSIPFQHSESLYCVRTVSNNELLSCYGFQQNLTASESTLDQLLSFSMPASSSLALAQHLDSTESFLDTLPFASPDICDTAPCYISQTSPTPISSTLKWTEAYASDPSTNAIIEGLSNHDSKTWSANELALINKFYHQKLKNGEIELFHGKLIHNKCIFPDSKFIALIIVPSSLRQAIFDYYHSGPLGAHMGEYKTLTRIRLRFTWPHLRNDIKSMLTSCAHCQAYNSWRSRRLEVHFSWPVTTPFYIMHCDLWSPGHLSSSSSKNIHLLNCMCDLSTFVVSSVTNDTRAETLARIFIEQVVLTFGTCAVIVVDADSSFRGTFEAMCSILKVRFWALARNNHKGLSVEHYHRFLNKITTITSEEHGSVQIIHQVYKLAQYAWNSAQIHGTDITRSLVALGRDLLFPLDTELRPLPKLNEQDHAELFEYLRNMSDNSKFATEVVKIIVEERRKSMRARVNSTKTQPSFKVGDVVKVHVQVQSSTEQNRVGKLSYKIRGPYQIIKDHGNNSYDIQRYGNPNGAIKKHRACDLYLLPPNLYPSNPLDTMDQRFLNFDHSPVQNPLHRPLRIESRADQFLLPPTALQVPLQDQPQHPIDIEAITPHHPPSDSPPTLPPEPTTPLPPPQPSTPSLHESIINSRDKLFFIKYTPNGTVRERWYLIQIDLEATEDAKLDPIQTQTYWCVFHAKHANDEKKSDEIARWWPLWYEYTTSEDNVITYGKRILFRPDHLPSSEKYIQWAEPFHLPSIHLFGPFDFLPIDSSNRTKNIVPLPIWRSFRDICIDLYLEPPTFGAHNGPKMPTTNSSKSRKNKRKSTSS